MSGGTNEYLNSRYNSFIRLCSLKAEINTLWLPTKNENADSYKNKTAFQYTMHWDMHVCMWTVDQFYFRWVTIRSAEYNKKRNAPLWLHQRCFHDSELVLQNFKLLTTMLFYFEHLRLRSISGRCICNKSVIN